MDAVCTLDIVIVNPWVFSFRLISINSKHLYFRFYIGSRYKGMTDIISVLGDILVSANNKKIHHRFLYRLY